MKLSTLSSQRQLHIFLIFLACLLPYVHSFAFPFFWDDYGLIVENKFAKSWSYVGELFRSPFGGDYSRDMESVFYYRPLTMFTYLINHTLLGNAPTSYRFVSFAIHILNCFLIYALASLWVNRSAAFLAAFFFGIHPIHTETVTYISNRGDLLYSFFILLGFYIFMVWRKKPTVILGVGIFLCFLAALLSKESAVIFPLLLLSCSLCFKSPLRRKEILLESVAFLFLMGYFFLHLFVVHVPPLKVSALGWRIISAAPLLFSYLKIFFWPHPLYMCRTAFQLNSHSAPVAFLATLFSWIILFLLVFVSRKNRSVFFVILWLLASCIPLLIFVPFVLPGMAEHHFYLPSIGLFVLAGALGHAGYQKVLSREVLKRGLRIFYVTLALSLGVLTFLRNAEYRSAYLLYSQTIEHAPDCWMARTNLGSLYLKKGLVRKAKKELIKSIKLNPRNRIAFFTLGITYYLQGQYQETLSRFRYALADGKNCPPYFHLWQAKVLVEVKQFKEAKKNLLLSLRDLSLRDQAYNLLGVIAERQGNWEEALRKFHQALEVNPRNAHVYRNLGTLYFRRGLLTEARTYLMTSMQLAPGRQDTEFFLKEVEASINLTHPIEPKQMTQAREEMVAFQLRRRGIQDEKVLGVMGRIPRHQFVPEALRQAAYEDGPLPIGEGQTISQPYIVARMTELLALKGTEKVLEIGTGSGYQAAVLAEMVPEVYTMEILPTLSERAFRTLENLHYHNVHVKTGNGYLGWPEEAPFDAIIVTAAPPFLPHALIEQLKVGGVLVIPIGSPQQQMLWQIRKTPAGLKKKTVIPVSFVPMVQ